MTYQRENQENYKSLLILHKQISEVARIGSWIFSPDENRLSWSQITMEIYEVAPDYVPTLEKANDFFLTDTDRDYLRNVISVARDQATSFDLESKIVTTKGREIWKRTTGRCVEKNGIVIRIYGTVQDITEKKFGDREIRRKENMLKAIAVSTESLLSDTDIYTAIANCLVVIGEAVDADRVYLFQNSLTPENKLIASQKIEWNSGIADPQIDNPELQNVPIEIFDSFLANLYQRIPFNAIVDQLSPDLAIREIFISQNIKSILIFPIFCRNQFWGYVGFDECKYSRQWAEDDISILQSFCNSISSAIERTIVTNDENFYLITSILSQNQIHINNYGNNITELKKALHDLELARRKAEESSLLKEVFLSNMSHEIRTPLNAVIGMLRELSRESLTHAQHLYVNNAAMANKHLLSIINDILDITKINSGQISLDLRNFNLHEILDEAISILSPAAQEKMLKISLVKNHLLAQSYIGDANRIMQILVRIISNAVKFTETGSITVECKALSNKKKIHHLLIRISDTGIGMDAEFLKNIFEKFNQKDFSIIRKHGGIGLGMSLTNELVEMINGKIRITSQPGVGTTVEVELNLEACAPSNIKRGASPAESIILKNKNILLVEDNYLNRIVANNSLRFHGMNITEATNGIEAIEKLKIKNVDLILMDLQMPEMGGLEATEIIRNSMGIQIPIIALTANAYKAEIARCFTAGMNDYIIKPFDEITLIETILRHIMQSATPEPSDLIEEVELTDAKLFDLDFIISMSRGNNDFIKKMIAVFTEETPEAVGEIKRAWANGDFATIRLVSHRIKPNLANFGVNDLKQDIETIEILAEEGLATEELGLRIQRLDEVIREVIKQLAIEKY